MENKQVYRKTITILQKYVNEKVSKKGKKYTVVSLMSSMKEYFSTLEKQGIIEDCIKGTKVDLSYTDTQNPKYKNIVQIFSVGKDSRPASDLGNKIPTSPAKEQELPPFPVPMPPAFLDAIIATAKGKIQTHFNTKAEYISPDNGLLGKLVEAQVLAYNQQFWVAMEKRKEAHALLQVKRWGKA